MKYELTEAVLDDRSCELIAQVLEALFCDSRAVETFVREYMGKSFVTMVPWDSSLSVSCLNLLRYCSERGAVGCLITVLEEGYPEAAVVEQLIEELCRTKVVTKHY